VSVFVTVWQFAGLAGHTWPCERENWPASEERGRVLVGAFTFKRLLLVAIN